MIFPVKVKNNNPNNIYSPIKPNNVNKVLPEETVGDIPSLVFKSP